MKEEKYKECISGLVNNTLIKLTIDNPTVLQKKGLEAALRNNKSLKVLIFWQCNTAIIPAVLRALHHPLKELHIYRTKITFNDAISLVNFLRKNRDIIKFKLWNTELNLAAGLLIFKQVLQCKKLELLSLYEIKTDASLGRFLLENLNMPSLLKFDINGTHSSISSSSIANFIERHPHLVVLDLFGNEVAGDAGKILNVVEKHSRLHRIDLGTANTFCFDMDQETRLQLYLSRNRLELINMMLCNATSTLPKSLLRIVAEYATTSCYKQMDSFYEDVIVGYKLVETELQKSRSNIQKPDIRGIKSISGEPLYAYRHKNPVSGGGRGGHRDESTMRPKGTLTIARAV